MENLIKSFQTFEYKIILNYEFLNENLNKNSIFGLQNHENDWNQSRATSKIGWAKPNS